jgi:hypothetical protein
MFQAIKDERNRKKHIRELNDFIAKTIEEETKSATTTSEHGEAYQRACSMLSDEFNERDSLRQMPWLAVLWKEGVLIPNEYWEERYPYQKPVLNSHG